MLYGLIERHGAQHGTRENVQPGMTKTSWLCRDFPMDDQCTKRAASRRKVPRETNGSGEPGPCATRMRVGLGLMLLINTFMFTAFCRARLVDAVAGHHGASCPGRLMMTWPLGYGGSKPWGAMASGHHRRGVGIAAGPDLCQRRSYGAQETVVTGLLLVLPTGGVLNVEIRHLRKPTSHCFKGSKTSAPNHHLHF